MRAFGLVSSILMVVALSGCAGGGSGTDLSSDHSFTSATQHGQLIPPAGRRAAGAVEGDLLRGGHFRLSEQRGKAVVINFWATWCPPCVAEVPEFDRIFRRHSDTVLFVGIDTKDQREIARTFVSDHNISYPIVFDQSGRAAVQLGKLPLTSLPATLLIDRRGAVAAVYLGRVTQSELETALGALVAERPLEPEPVRG